jgi:hypothetical protein
METDNYWIGAIILSIGVGFQFSLLYGFFALGGFFMFAGLWSSVDDSIVKIIKARKGKS